MTFDPMEIILVALVIFGPKKLPELGKSLGQGIREFKKSARDSNVTSTSPLRAITTRPDEGSPSRPRHPPSLAPLHRLAKEPFMTDPSSCRTPPTSTTTLTTSTTSACVLTMPSETAGPYPADGSRASGQSTNVLTRSGIVPCDLRTSLGTKNKAGACPSPCR